jgi:hypothetical protein
MATCSYYSLTPCCGGHPVSVKRTDINGNIVLFNPYGLKVYIFQPSNNVPYTDHLGHSLIPGQCYDINIAYYTDPNWDDCEPLEALFVPCPTATNFVDTPYESCAGNGEDEPAKDPICNCTNAFIITACCPDSEPLVYNITNYDGSIVDGFVYNATLNPPDLSSAGCYLFQSTTVEDPSLLPTLDISYIATESPTTCETSICFLLCQPCRCQIFTDDPNIPGSNGIYLVVTCDLRTAFIYGSAIYSTPTPIIVYTGDPTQYPLTEGICLKYWQEQTPGLLRANSGECEIVYWDQTGIEANCPIYYKIVNCQEPFNEICVTNDLSTEYASNQIITINGQPDLCWRIEQVNICQSPITIIVTETHLDCQDCLDKILTYYQLINCNDESQIIYTSSNLSGFGPYISLEEYPDDCWFVTALISDVPVDTLVTPIQSFGSCIECSQQYYILEDCNIDNPELPIITGTDLSAYVGQVITLASCPDICWEVSTTDNTIDSQPVLLDGIENFATCEDCLPTPPQPTPPVYKYKSVRPGYNTPGCSPEKYEQYMCNFSEAMYRQVMVDAYGIEPCCGDDDIKWQIKKELIELKAITDPDYNCTLTSSCDCTTSTNGLTPCVPPVVVCHRYIVSVQSNEGTSFSYTNCSGNVVTQDVPSGKVIIQYNVCGISGQTIQTPPNVIEFTYEETTTNCTT